MDKRFVLHEYQIDRDLLAEADLGIDTINAFGYLDGNYLFVHGEINSKMIFKHLYLECLVYDADGDLVAIQQNKNYGCSSISVNVISKEFFFDGFPFSFTVYVGETTAIGHIVIRPVPVQI